jgi:hypothetical protein
MATQQRPSRSATAETVRELASYSGYPLAEDRIDLHVTGVNQILDIVKEWEQLPLAYRFEESGEFGNAPIEAQYWATWRSSRQKAGGAR